MGNMTRQFLLEYGTFKKKFGNTQEFKEFEKQYSEEIKFIKFKNENKLHYSKKNGWNKPFTSTGKMVWITTPRKNWNKDLKKYGHWLYVAIGWRLLDKFTDDKCQWCGKLLTDSRQKSCNKNEKKYFSKVITAGKKRHGFDLSKQNHILIKPKLYDYEITEKGSVIEIKSKNDRIESKDIEFSINGERFPYTKKSRTV